MAHYDKKATNSYALGTQATFYLLEARPDLAVRIYISPKQTRDATYDKLVEKARSLHLPVIENNAKIFKELSDKDNVMAIGEFRKFEGRLETKNNHLVLVNPSNMGNLGTILRTAVGFGIHDVAIIGVSADAFDPKVVRASMGAIFFLNLAFFPDFESYRSVYPNH
ncbi:MAG: TrmH family RNA methyltransferase, partial [Bacilli bacterium]|nr:TrmH family RNA methyltransferase [Bacilli bacterium]